VNPGDIPYKTPDDETAIDRAKHFCRSSSLTPNDVKIVKRDGFVMVVVKRAGVTIRLDKEYINGAK
jgi:ribosomal protein L36